MIIIADTSPINYLVLTGFQEILPILFGQILIPEAVLDELQSPATPPEVKQWIANGPQWLEVRKLKATPDLSLSHDSLLNAMRKEKQNNPNDQGEHDETFNA